jgi:tetratricopeptide (TPR) repeat protein
MSCFRKFQVASFSKLISEQFANTLHEASDMPSHAMDADSEVTEPTRAQIYEEQVVFGEPMEGVETARPPDYNEYEFDANSIDVTGSPRLTRLIGFLTIEECNNIPDLDLAGDNLEIGDIWSQDLLGLCSRYNRHGEEEDAPGNELSTSTSDFPVTLKTSRIIGNLEIWTKKWFDYEVYPFPTHQSSAAFPYDFSRMVSSRGSSRPRMSESQCRKKLRSLKQLEHVEVIHLLGDMSAVARNLRNDRDYAKAEIWFRRIITTKQVKQLIAWHNPQHTLWACTFVINCILCQGRYQEAYQLHHDFHDKLERVLGADHDVTCYSRVIKGDILSSLGSAKEEEAVFRNHLQVCLTSLGTEHPRTVRALETLGSVLGRSNRRLESQRLLETSIHFQLQHAKITESNKADVLLSMTHLARGLIDDEKYDESEAVLHCAQKLLGDTTRTRSHTAYIYHHTRAHTYLLQRRLPVGEKIVRSLLRYHAKSMQPNTKANFMWRLTDILMKTNRESEAAYWFKRRYVVNVEALGPLNFYTMAACWHTGFCYARQGRYHAARQFFRNAIEALTSSTDDENSRLKCVQEINAWMSRVEAMRLKDPMPRNLMAEDVEMADLDVDSEEYWRKFGDLPDICPLQRR